MFYRLLVPISIVFVAVIDSVFAVTPPCPVPQLAFVNTEEKCACFYALAGSDFDVGDSSTFDAVLNDESVQDFAQTGTFIGIDGITEYLQWVGGKFIEDFIPLTPYPLFLDMTGTTEEQCVITMAEMRRMPFNAAYIQDNKEICIDVVAGNVLSYTLTGNPEAPITIQKISSWLPDEVVSVSFPLLVNTAATAEFVCDVLVDTCGYDGSRRRLKSKTTSKTKRNKSANKAPKNRKGHKQSDAKKKCLATYNSLPDVDQSGGLTYADGDTKGCRVIHALMAEKNSAHCPHVSFDAEEDINGLVKCNKSKKTPLTDIFTETQLGLFMGASAALGLPTGIDVKFESCPVFTPAAL